MKQADNIYAWLKKVLQSAESAKNRMLIGSLLFALFFLLHIPRIDLSNRIDVLYGSDEWDYQSIAVNFAKGHGFHLTGSFEKSEVYKFGTVDEGIYEKQELIKGITNIHRPPLYPLFIGAIYKIFGIHPAIIVVLQLIILCFVVAGFAQFAYHLMGKAGFWAGSVAGFLFMFRSYDLANVFLPGLTFSTLWVFLFVFTTHLFLRYGCRKWLAMASAILAVSLLFHATMILVAGFMGIYLFIRFLKKYQKEDFRNILIFTGILTVILLPWHIFAFKTLDTLKKESSSIMAIALDSSLNQSEKINRAKSEAPVYGGYLLPERSFNQQEINIINDSLIPHVKYKGLFINALSEDKIDFHKMAMMQELIDAPRIFPVFLSISKNMALHSHNEYVEGDNINTDWQSDLGSFYNNDKSEGTHAFLRVLNFYKTYPYLLFTLASKKINAAFGHFFFFRFLVFTLGLSTIFRSLISVNFSLFLKVVLGLFLAALFTFICFYIENIAVAILAYTLCIFCNPIKNISTAFNWVLFNLIVFTCLAFGNSRYIEPTAGLFILFAMLFATDILKMFIKKISCELFKKNSAFLNP